MLLEHPLPDREWEGVMLEEQGKVRTYREIMTLLSLCWGVIEEFGEGEQICNTVSEKRGWV